MSKKVLKLAGRRPMLLALIVMATLALGIVFSGWLTPTRLKAQQGGGNGGSNDESTDCVESGTITNCSEGSVVLSTVVVTPVIGCIGSGFGATDTNIITPGQVIIDTSYTNANPNATNPTCSDTFTTNNPSPTVVSNWWTASVGSFSTNGTGLSASFTPTSCGSGSITFNTAYQDVCDTNINTTSASGSFTVDAVTSLTPSAGLLVDDGDHDPNTDTYLVQYGCYDTITVTAGDCAGLSPANLPSCWTMSGGTEIDKKNHSVDGNTVGKTEIDVNCGTSYKKVTIIVYQAKFEIDADRGDCFLDDVGHSWWNLSVQPSDVYQFLKKSDGTPLSGRLGVAGYYGDGSISCAGDTGCPGQVKFGPQPNSSGGYHSATGSHWWCISVGKLIGALTYVDDLANSPGTYVLYSNNCTTQAEQVEAAAGAPVGYTSIYPCGLSDYLNTLPASTCSCGP